MGEVRGTRQYNKKDFMKKPRKSKDDSHWEGKHFCDCRIRNKRKWLGVKRGLTRIEKE